MAIQLLVRRSYSTELERLPSPPAARGDLAGADGPASVFVDIIGLPFTPLSFAGVARRTARRAYWYGVATAGAAAAYGYPYYRPPPYYGPPL